MQRQTARNSLSFKVNEISRAIFCPTAKFNVLMPPSGGMEIAMDNKNNWKAWLYLLPAIIFLGVFMVYPLVDVLIYSFEEGYNSASQTYFGVGTYNFEYVLRDPYFLQAVKNTFILVVITVPLSTCLYPSDQAP